MPTMWRKVAAMTKRELVFQQIKVAGYHGDYRTATRLLIENPISRKRYNEAWESGAKAKAAGVPCNCYQCKRGAP